MRWSAFITIRSSSSRKPSPAGLDGARETFAMAMVSKAMFKKGSAGVSGAEPMGRETRRRTISLVPPPAGIRPTPASTRPM
jgi:hypothetical protein